MPPNKLKIATLSSSYNRIKKTTAFLQSLVHQQVGNEFDIDYYLLDDNSPDGTAAYIELNFPQVNVIKGSGSLFWAGGMRTLWHEVLKRGEYDFFLLLNDDVVLFDDALSRLLKAYSLSGNPGNILLGSVRDPKNERVTYGGLKLKNKLTGNFVIENPDPVNLKPCDIGHANIMLVDRFTVDKIGILSDLYTHGIADFDYTLTAKKNDLNVWLAPGLYGYCENDHGVSWLPQSTPLKKRIEYLYSPKGLALKEYLVYLKRHFPLSLPDKFVKAWLKTFFPVIYDTFKKEV